MSFDGFDAVKCVEKELNIPESHLMLHRVDQTVVTAMVHEEWLNQLLKDLKIPEKFTSNDEQLKHILSQTLKLSKPWKCLSIQIFIKRSGVVSMFQKCQRSGSLSKNEDLDYSHLIHYITETNFKNLWKDISKKYNKTLPHDRRDEHHIKKQDFNDAIREGLTRIYSCPLISSVNIKRSDEGVAHGNILKAYCIIECCRAFYVIQHYIKHTLEDCLTFSPAVLGSSYCKPLFVVYQLLEAMRELHDRGMFTGDLSLNDVCVDENLWVFIRPRLWHSLMKEVKNGDSKMKLLSKRVEHSNRVGDTNCKYKRLTSLVENWVRGNLSNFDYLMELNNLAGRRMGDANHHPILPWVTDLSVLNGGWRDLSKSKYRLNKGDKQLDLTYECTLADGESLHVPHHVADVLTDITYYVYMARRIPQSILCRHVRPNWVPAEYPSSIERMQAWTPDECIPEFYTDSTVFRSIHQDLPDLKIPSWATDVDDFIMKHRAALESDYVSERLHMWIDLTFGYRLAGSAAVKSKNVFLNLVDQHTHLSNCGINQIFNQPHPQRLNFSLYKIPPKLKRITSKETKRKEKYSDDVFNKENDTSDVTDSLKILTKKKSLRSQTSELKCDQQTIYLPKDYNPLLVLNQLEATYNLTAKSMFQVPFSSLQDEQNGTTSFSNNILHQRKTRDLVSLGCLIVELFLPSRFRLISCQTELEERYDLLCKILRVDAFELPRCVKSIVKLLLERNNVENCDKISLPVRYSTITELGLPPPSPHQLIEPLIQLLPFPNYFQNIYLFLSLVQLAKSQYEQEFGEEEMKNISCQLIKLLPQLKSEGVNIIIPFLQEMFAHERTDVLAAWYLFTSLAQALGPKETKKHFLTYLIPIYDRDTFTPKWLKLFHRNFLLELMVRLGLRTFLEHFVTRLIEAVGGFKDYATADENNRRKTSHLHSPDVEVTQDVYETMLSPFEDECLHNEEKININKEDKNDSDIIEDFEPELEMFYFDPVNQDFNIEEHLTVSCETGDTVSLDDATCESPTPMLCLDDDDDYFNESSPNEIHEHDCNVSDVATENVDWLCHRLGPVLTAKYLSRNLLRMLSLCYYGGDQLLLVDSNHLNDDMLAVSMCNKKIVGDNNAANVLVCLAKIVILYGEQFILVQYLPHVVELISCCAKRFTANFEAGVVGSMTLLKYILPYMSNATLMDNLQDILIKDILYPTIQLISSQRISFPSGGLARRVIAFKLLDVLYLIGLRIGFEMTRKHLTLTLQRFFSSFDRVYLTNNEISKVEALDELKETFDSEMAYISYISFCKLAGDIHMEKSLENEALVRQLVMNYDKQVVQKCQEEKEKGIKDSMSQSAPIDTWHREEEHIVSGTFGKNVAIVGNRIDIQTENVDNTMIGEKREKCVSVKSDVGKEDIFNSICKKMENNRRHLRGSWLAYWDHEIGRSEKDLKFNFKQIKLQTFLGHTASVRSIYCLDNEISFVSASKDKTVKLWSLRSHGDGSAHSNCQWTYPYHKKSVFAVTFLESLRTIGSCDGNVHLWDPFMGSCLKQMDPVKNSSVSVLTCLPPPSSVLVAASTDSCVRFLDARLMKYVHEYKVSIGPAGLIRCISVGPDGHWLCVGHSSGVISILDVRTGLVSATWKGHEGEILQIRAYNKNMFVTSSLDQHVSVWNADDGKLQYHLRGPTEPVHCFDFYRNEMISATTANRVGVHTSIDNQASFSSTRLRSDTFRGMISSLTILPLNRLILMGADNGNISLLC